MAILKDEKSDLEIVLQAVHELELAQKYVEVCFILNGDVFYKKFVIIFRYFQYLSVHGDKTRFNIEVAGLEANQCQDLLSQAQYHVSRARRIDEEEKALKRKQEEERMAFKMRQEEERKRREEIEKSSREQMLAKRQEYVEKTKNLILTLEVPQEKERKKG